MVYLGGRQRGDGGRLDWQEVDVERVKGGLRAGVGELPRRVPREFALFFSSLRHGIRHVDSQIGRRILNLGKYVFCGKARDRSMTVRLLSRHALAPIFSTTRWCRASRFVRRQANEVNPAIVKIAFNRPVWAE